MDPLAVGSLYIEKLIDQFLVNVDALAFDYRL